MGIECYEILVAVTPGGLAKDVNKRIASGWQPLGGVTYGPGGFAQAIVKPKSNA